MTAPLWIKLDEATPDSSTLQHTGRTSMVRPLVPPTSFSEVERYGDHRSSAELTAEEVAIAGKSRKQLVSLFGVGKSNTYNSRSGDRQVHTGLGVYFDSDSQSVHQVRSHCPRRNQLYH
jgi:hypothetical protein